MRHRQAGRKKKSGDAPRRARVLALAVIAVPHRVLLRRKEHLAAGGGQACAGALAGDRPRSALEKAGLAEVLAHVRARAVFAAPGLGGGGAGWEVAGPRVRVRGAAEVAVDERDAAGGEAGEGVVGGGGGSGAGCLDGRGVRAGRGMREAKECTHRGRG